MVNMNDPKIQNLQDEITQLTNDWKRALADYQNLVKRFEMEKKEVVKLANANLISKLVPCLDILELAAQHSEDTGVKMAVKQFQDVLSEENLEVVLPKAGDIFDHNYHDCIEKLEDGVAGTIAEIVTKGYKIDDTVLRPAKVKVYKSKI